ncbi:MAG: hypothetical protein ACFFBD_05915 [Candidatus Hodarchaeota archaeon]
MSRVRSLLDRLNRDLEKNAGTEDSSGPNPSPLELDSVEDWAEDWIHLKSLLRCAQHFVVNEDKEGLVLLPLKKNFQDDLEILVHESSFLTNLLVVARISDGKIHLDLMK